MVQQKWMFHQASGVDGVTKITRKHEWPVMHLCQNERCHCGVATV